MWKGSVESALTFTAEAARTIHWLQLFEVVYLLNLGAARAVVANCTA